MKLSRNQWFMVLGAILVVVLLWWLAYRMNKGSGGGRGTSVREETSAGDASLPDPMELSNISMRTSTTRPSPTTTLKRRETLI